MSNGATLDPGGANPAAPHKICHRSISASIVMAQAPGGIEGSRIIAGQARPVAIALQAPCIGDQCRMWNAQIQECEEVHAAQNVVVLNNVIVRATEEQKTAATASAKERVDGINLLLAEIREMKAVLMPPKGGRKPLEIEIVEPVTVKKYEGDPL